MMISGDGLRGFRKGWAIVQGAFGSGHYFVRQGLGDEAESACGLMRPVSSLWGIGTWKCCTKCLKKHGPPTDVRTCIDRFDGGAT